MVAISQMIAEYKVACGVAPLGDSHSPRVAIASMSAMQFIGSLLPARTWAADRQADQLTGRSAERDRDASGAYCLKCGSDPGLRRLASPRAAGRELLNTSAVRLREFDLQLLGVTAAGLGRFQPPPDQR